MPKSKVNSTRYEKWLRAMGCEGGVYSSRRDRPRLLAMRADEQLSIKDREAQLQSLSFENVGSSALSLFFFNQFEQYTTYNPS